MQVLSKLRNPSILIRSVFVAILVLWPLMSNSQFCLNVMVMAGLYAITAVGLSLLMGTAGQISLGQSAFFGIGAYTSVILTMRLHIPAVLSLLVGAVLAGVVAFIVGRPILRLKHVFLAIATMGLGEIFLVVAREATWLTGGHSGIVNVPWFNIGSFVFDSNIKQYYLVWGVALVILFLTERAVASRVGRTLRALAVSEIAASTLGIHTADWKLRTFVLSAVYAAIGGGFFGFIMMSISSDSFSTSMSMIVMIMVIIGGISSLFGGVVGVIVLSWLGQVFSSYQQYSGILYALVLLLLLIFLPDGLVGGWQSRPVQYLRRVLQRFAGWTAVRLRLKQNTLGNSPKIKEHSLTERWQLLVDSKAREPMASDEPLLRIEGISVVFGGIQAVNEVSLSLQAGKIAALIGPNGAGKSTLFNVISGVQKPTAGRVWFMGLEITNQSPANICRLGMARTFQNLRIFGNMTVLENVMVGRHRHESAGFITAALGKNTKEEQESRRRSMEALALVGLEQLAEWPVTSLPYGQQRLVEIARALATEPRLLMLDEPGAGMNSTEKVQLMERISWIHKAGVTVLLVEHDMDLVMGISDTVSVLDYGKLIAEGTPKDIQANPAVIEAYVGVKHKERQEAAASDATVKADIRGLAGAEVKALLEVQNISTYYGSICALRDVSIQVYPGEIVTVLGSNGAGKTTLLRTISGLFHPSSGNIMFENRNVNYFPPEKISALGIGHVPEGRLIFHTLSVQDNLMLGGVSMRRDKTDIRKDWEFVYDLFPRLAERRHQIAGTLSGGEQQMLAIGRALMGRPKLLLLDEPSMGLAPMVIELIFQTLVKLNQEQGLTLVIVEQNAEMALSIAHHAVVLQTGAVALAGRAEHIAQDKRVCELYLGHGQEKIDPIQQCNGEAIG